MFIETAILDVEAGCVNLEKFRNLFYQGDLNIYDLIDLICGYNTKWMIAFIKRINLIIKIFLLF
jgi:hypothetical protein